MMTSMVFYGLGMNAGNLAGSIYLNFFMQSFAEVIGFAGCIAFLHKVGRKPVFILSIEISGIACLATFIPVVYLGPGMYNNLHFSGISRARYVKQPSFMWSI